MRKSCGNWPSTVLHDLWELTVFFLLHPGEAYIIFSVFKNKKAEGGGSYQYSVGKPGEAVWSSLRGHTPVHCLPIVPGYGFVAISVHSF